MCYRKLYTRTPRANCLQGKRIRQHEMLTWAQIMRIMSMGQGRGLVLHLRVPSAGGLGSTSRFFLQGSTGSGAY